MSSRRAHFPGNPKEAKWIISARQFHLISSNSNQSLSLEIQAGVRVEFLLMTLDTTPKVAHLDIPILGTSPLMPGEIMQGWFNLPLPFESANSDRMLYVFVDDLMSGPVRIPKSQP